MHRIFKRECLNCIEKLPFAFVCIALHTSPCCSSWGTVNHTETAVRTWSISKFLKKDKFNDPKNIHISRDFRVEDCNIILYKIYVH